MPLSARRGAQSAAGHPLGGWGGWGWGSGVGGEQGTWGGKRSQGQTGWGCKRIMKSNPGPGRGVGMRGRRGGQDGATACHERYITPRGRRGSGMAWPGWRCKWRAGQIGAPSNTRREERRANHLKPTQVHLGNGRRGNASGCVDRVWTRHLQRGQSTCIIPGRACSSIRPLPDAVQDESLVSIRDHGFLVPGGLGSKHKEPTLETMEKVEV